MKFLVSIVVLVCLTLSSHAFAPRNSLTRTSGHVGVSALKGHFEEADAQTALPSGSLQAERYVATNRFTVRPGKGAKFEKRWADRTSRLAQLEGFRFFSLLKRVDEPGVTSYNDEMSNYLSLTVWRNKDNFQSWRSGDAFKEAHSGGGRFPLSGFVKLLTTALFILKGSPKPAFFDGVLTAVDNHLSYSPQLSASAAKASGGWRKVAADGKNEITPEVFVSQERFTINPGQDVAFEQYYQQKLFSQQKQQSNSVSIDNGMLSFLLLRRDATKADDGVSFIAHRLWTSRAAWKEWYNQLDLATTPFIEPNVGQLQTTALYEGKLTLFSDEGV